MEDNRLVVFRVNMNLNNNNDNNNNDNKNRGSYAEKNEETCKHLIFENKL